MQDFPISDLYFFPIIIICVAYESMDLNHTVSFNMIDYWLLIIIIIDSYLSQLSTIVTSTYWFAFVEEISLSKIHGCYSILYKM